MKLLQDTQWDGSNFFPNISHKIISLFWIAPIGFGFMGWARWFKAAFFSKTEKSEGLLIGFSLALALFSLYVFGLAVNEILVWPLTALFFIAGLMEGWNGRKDFSFFGMVSKPGVCNLLLILPMSLWAFEYLSTPLIWDAILDHYRFAREVSRLHQILFHWTNHTGDMPKAAELVLAGFWNLGGESLSKLSSALPAVLTSWLLILFSREGNKTGELIPFIFWTCPFFLALYSWGYVEGFLAFLKYWPSYVFGRRF